MTAFAYARGNILKESDLYKGDFHEKRQAATIAEENKQSLYLCARSITTISSEPNCN